jgi:hypothetical protein
METLLNAEWPSWTLFLNRRSFQGGALKNGPYSLERTRSSRYGKMEVIYSWRAGFQALPIPSLQ